MSNDLINALENRVTSAVDTIEGLRSEVRVLKEERQILEAKLRELLQKIDAVDRTEGAASASDASLDARNPGSFGAMGTNPTEY
jgi:FtsZ-binding cell division protein ZapB